VRLVDLEPQFIRREVREGGREFYIPVDGLNEANGLMFLCPGCFQAKGARPGVHSVLCYKPQIPSEVKPGPGRWPMTGSDYSDLTLTPSILLGCGWHGFITNGEVITV